VRGIRFHRSMTDIAIVLDCGATNASAVAVDAAGNILRAASRPNAPSPQLMPEADSPRRADGERGWLIWDLDQVWGKLCDACHEVCSAIDGSAIKAVAVTTFGADGAPVRADGSLTYPVISWQCERTRPMAQRLLAEIDAREIFAETGYQMFPFNTLLRFMWLRENAPRALEEAACWLMTPGLLSHRLCGEFSIDPTIGSTTMVMALRKRDWSERMLRLADLDASFFPRWKEPGEVIGTLLRSAAEQTGLPQGIPVVAAGHDTQFAIAGAGAGEGEAVLSSGTWEILSFRANDFRPTAASFEHGLICECDAQPGFWNPQMLMMGSAVLEWVRRHFFTSARGEEAYAQMVREAQAVPPGASGVTLVPSFVPDAGPTRRHGIPGALLGLTLTTQPGQIYRAALEGLSFQLRQALEILSNCTGFRARKVRVVGGGSKNAMWNQLRADALNRPVVAIGQQEATSLGAALFALVGAGVFRSFAETLESVDFAETVFEPSPDADRYDELYQRYFTVPQALAAIPDLPPPGPVGSG